MPTTYVTPSYAISDTFPPPEPGYTWVPDSLARAGLSADQFAVVIRFLILIQSDPSATPSDFNLYHVTRRKRSDSSRRAIQSAIDGLTGASDLLAEQMSDWIAG